MNDNPNNDIKLDTALEQLQAAAARPFDEARPIPAALNHSQAFLGHERQSVFMQEWISVGRVDEIPSHGDYLTYDIAGVAVLVVRQQDEQIGAFVNACAHRFACLMPDEKGSAKRFTCRYHAWTYDCDGSLIRAPGMEMKTGFDPASIHLRVLHFEVWEGFIYVSLADEPKTSLNQVLAPFRDQIVGRFVMGCYRTIFRESMVWHANWKNLIENFTESYHVPVVHGKTFAQHNKAIDTYVCGEDSDYYGYHSAAQPRESGPGAAHPNNNRLEGEWRRMMVDFCIFPCHLVTVMPDYLWYISVQPKGPDRMQATWSVAIPPEVLEDISDADYEEWLSAFKTYMEVANGEDKELVEALHRGTASPLLPAGVYHPIERNLWQFTNYLAGVCGSGR